MRQHRDKQLRQSVVAQATKRRPAIEEHAACRLVTGFGCEEERCPVVRVERIDLCMLRHERLAWRNRPPSTTPCPELTRLTPTMALHALRRHRCRRRMGPSELTRKPCKCSAADPGFWGMTWQLKHTTWHAGGMDAISHCSADSSPAPDPVARATSSPSSVAHLTVPSRTRRSSAGFAEGQESDPDAQVSDNVPRLRGGVRLSNHLPPPPPASMRPQGH